MAKKYLRFVILTRSVCLNTLFDITESVISFVISRHAKREIGRIIFKKDF